MAEVQLATAVVELRTCKLTKSILKQIPLIHDWNDLKKQIPVELRSPTEEQRLKAAKNIVAQKPEPSLEASFEEVRREIAQLEKKPSFQEWMQANIVGWLHGSARGEEYSRDLLVRVGEGSYVLYCNAHMETIAKHKQLFVL